MPIHKPSNYSTFPSKICYHKLQKAFPYHTSTSLLNYTKRCLILPPIHINLATFVDDIITHEKTDMAILTRSSAYNPYLLTATLSQPSMYPKYVSMPYL
jgi:hypothetical protein